MLTFEYHKKDAKLSIHGDAEGLKDSVPMIERLMNQTKDGEFEHEHLMTPEWDGHNLTSDKHSAEPELINHVNIACCNSKKGAA